MFNPTNESGFTLLELLLSLVILGIVMGVLYGGLQLGVRAWQGGEKRMERSQRWRVVLDQLAEEFRSAHALLVKGEIDGEEKKYPVFLGEQNQVIFVTSTSGLTLEPLANQLRTLSYYVDSYQGLMLKETTLYYQDPFKKIEGEDPVVLSPDVADISFRYYYIPKVKNSEGETVDAETGEWVASWDPRVKAEEFVPEEGSPGEPQPAPTQTQLPKAVEITITLNPEEEDGELQKFPPLVVPIQSNFKVKVKDEPAF